MVEFKTQSIVPPSEEFPSSDLPTIFADGIIKFANTAQMAKFYLFRFNPSLKDLGKAQTQLCAQIVMSIDALVTSFAFLEHTVKQLQTQGIVPEQTLEAARKALRGA